MAVLPERHVLTVLKPSVTMYGHVSTGMSQIPVRTRANGRRCVFEFYVALAHGCCDQFIFNRGQACCKNNNSSVPLSPPLGFPARKPISQAGDSLLVYMAFY